MTSLEPRGEAQPELPSKADGAVQDEALIAEATACRLREDWNGAVDCLQRVLAGDPGNAAANFNMGLTALDFGQAEAALQYLGRALDGDPAQGAYWLGYIRALHAAGKPGEARDVLVLARKQGLSGDSADALENVLFGDPMAGTASTGSVPTECHQGQPAPELVERMFGLYAQGALTEAEAMAKALTQRFPASWTGWKTLGVIYQRTGRIGDALPAMRRTVELLPNDAEAHNNLGIVLQGLRRFEEAIECYRQALVLVPEFAQAHGNMGTALKELGRYSEAASSCRQAITFDPAYARAYSNLGVILHAMHRYQEAETIYRRLLQFQPDHAEGWCNLGITLTALRRLHEAESCYVRAVELNPASVVALTNLGLLQQDLGRFNDAQKNLIRAHEIDPSDIDTLLALGQAKVYGEHFDEALGYFKKAISLSSERVDGYLAAWQVYTRTYRRDQALEVLRQGLSCNSASSALYASLGRTLQDLGRVAEAEANYRMAIEIDPKSSLAFNGLGMVLQAESRFIEAESAFKSALELAPAFHCARSNLLLLGNTLACESPDHYLTEAKAFGEAIDNEVDRPFATWSVERSPERLRVGFVSGDLKDHPVGYFIENLLAHLDGLGIEPVAYSADEGRPTELTGRLKPRFVSWNSIAAMSDRAAAEQIHGDGIHVLIDLSGHTALNRLPVFARRPAPVQASWLGYFATTGVREMDYLIGDPFVTPETEQWHFSESVWRLPETYLCFSPPSFPLEVGSAPAASTGSITFGCFNNLSKMGDDVVRLWARVLEAVPQSRLFLKTRQLTDPTLRAATLGRFAALGIGADRLLLEGGAPRAQLLAAYGGVDIALDPFPYPGGTTTAEALWMGVPVLTRRGDRFLSHVGESMLQNAGLPDWIARDDDDYVAKAARCSTDIEGLVLLRAQLRERVMASPLFDAERFARNFADAMWGMWRRWENQEKK